MVSCQISKRDRWLHNPALEPQHMKFPRFEFHISAGVTEFTSFAIVNASCNGIGHPQRPSRNILERHTDSSLRLDLGKIHRSVFFRGTGSQKHFSSNSYSQTNVISYMTG